MRYLTSRPYSGGTIDLGSTFTFMIFDMIPIMRKIFRMMIVM